MRLALVSIPALALALTLAACQPAEPQADGAQAAAAEADTPLMPADAPPQEEPDLQVSAAGGADDDTPCSAEIGAAAAARLVERCIKVSPATHPPCNALNPCAMIQSEIDRSCAMFPEGEKPAECAA